MIVTDARPNAGPGRHRGSSCRSETPPITTPRWKTARARPAPRPAADPGASAFAAQMIGQTGQRKGLKGGPPVLGAARSTYLGTEYSGPNERRPGAGKGKRTDV